MERVLRVCLTDEQGLPPVTVFYLAPAFVIGGTGYARTSSLKCCKEHEQRNKRRLANMRTLWRKAIQFKIISRQIAAVALGLLLAAPAFAQANSPWENAVNVLQTAFTSTIARGLSLVAIVVSGLTFAFGEGGSKRVLAGVLFGVGMAIAAVNFLAWLFPG
jgi:type IV secretory pathway VirB2 component (pilin)